jgi:hypothetical protein
MKFESWAFALTAILVSFTARQPPLGFVFVHRYFTENRGRLPHFFCAGPSDRPRGIQKWVNSSLVGVARSGFV